MRQNVSLPLTVQDIAQAAGCSTRALATTFRSERGQTVTSALREMRLDAARSDLLAGNADLTVNAVCTRFGFSNIGRFAAMYRDRFGALPRQTRSRRA